MNEKRNAPGAGGPIAKARLIKALCLIVFTLLLFLLIHSMVHHRFFSGGPFTNRDNTSTP